jgi:hypothetical protein
MDLFSDELAIAGFEMPLVAELMDYAADPRHICNLLNPYKINDTPDLLSQIKIHLMLFQRLTQKHDDGKLCDCVKHCNIKNEDFLLSEFLSPKTDKTSMDIVINCINVNYRPQPFDIALNCIKDRINKFIEMQTQKEIKHLNPSTKQVIFINKKYGFLSSFAMHMSSFIAYLYSPLKFPTTLPPLNVNHSSWMIHSKILMCPLCNVGYGGFIGFPLKLEQNTDETKYACWRNSCVLKLDYFFEFNLDISAMNTLNKLAFVFLMTLLLQYKMCDVNIDPAIYGYY